MSRLLSFPLSFFPAACCPFASIKAEAGEDWRRKGKGGGLYFVEKAAKSSLSKNASGEEKGGKEGGGGEEEKS